MSDSNIPPLPEPVVIMPPRLWSDTEVTGHTADQMRAYGLLCLRQGWKMGAEKCAEECVRVDHEAVIRGNDISVYDYRDACTRIASSDSPK